jgi:hypothetical protein
MAMYGKIDKFGRNLCSKERSLKVWCGKDFKSNDPILIESLSAPNSIAPEKTLLHQENWRLLAQLKANAIRCRRVPVARTALLLLWPWFVQCIHPSIRSLDAIAPLDLLHLFSLDSRIAQGFTASLATFYPPGAIVMLPFLINRHVQPVISDVIPLAQ